MTAENHRRCRPTSPAQDDRSPRTSSSCRSRAATRSACAGAQGRRRRRQLQQLQTSPTSGTAASASTAAAPTRTTSRSTARRRSARARPARSIGIQNVDDAPGSAGPDGQLHARVRARERRADPHGDQERQQPLQRQRLVLLPRRVAAGQYLDAQPAAPNAADNSGAGAVRLQAVRLLVRRPDPRCDVQGQAVLLRRAGVGQLLRRCRPTPPRCRPRRCAAAISASCSAPNPFFSTPQIIRDPPTGQPFPRTTSSRRTCSVANGVALLNVYPLPTRGIPARRQQRDSQQREPAGSAQGQHPLRLPVERKTTSSRTGTASTTGWRSTPSAARSRSRAPTGIARTPTQTVSWTEHDQQQSDQRVQLHRTRSIRCSSTSSRVGSLQAQHVRDQLSRTSSRTTRKSRTRSRRSRSPTSPSIDGGPYPSSSQGPIHTFSNATTWVKGRHTFKGGVVDRVLGRGRLRPDQRAADPRQHQQPERPLPVHQQRRRRAPGWRWPTRRSACSPTTPRSASAR